MEPLDRPVEVREWDLSEGSRRPRCAEVLNTERGVPVFGEVPGVVPFVAAATAVEHEDTLARAATDPFVHATGDPVLADVARRHELFGNHTTRLGTGVVNPRESGMPAHGCRSSHGRPTHKRLFVSE
jgi:hypothetical protein